MIRKISRFLSRELSGLQEAAFLLGLSSVASAVLALIRDRLFAHTFGAGVELDVYYAAFRIPDFLFVSIASLVSVTVLIPFLVKKIDHETIASANRFLSEVLTVFLVVMVAVCVLVFLFMPLLARLVAPGFGDAALVVYVKLSRILLLSPLLLGLSNLLGGATQSLRRFMVYALSPILYNLGIIAGVLLFYPHLGLSGLAWGVVFGALLHGLIQIPTILDAGFRPRLIRTIDWRHMREVIGLSIPRTIGLGLSQIVIMVLIGIATYLKTGSIAIFNFAFNLQSVPLSVIGVSYSVAAFPALARSVSSGTRKQFAEEVSVAVRYILFWSLPIAAFIIAMKGEIVSLVLGTGRFTRGDVDLTAACLAIFVCSVAAQGLLLLFTRSYYAAGETRKPVIANMISALLTIVFAFIITQNEAIRDMLSGALGHLFGFGSDVDTRILFLPLVFSFGMIGNTTLHWVSFVYDFPVRGKDLVIPLVRSLCAAVLVVLVLDITIPSLVSAPSDPTVTLGVLVLALGIALAVTIPVYILTGSLELHEIKKSLAQKFGKSLLVAPDAKEL